MNNKKFTLIELIVVIAILGILASLIVPNISSFKGDATVTAISSNVRNFQTSVDMYSLKNNGEYPTINQPTEFIPQPIDFSKLDKKYVKTLPKTNGVKYWVDFEGRVWASTIDAPTGVSNTNGSITWSPVTGAVKYQVFELEGYQGIIGTLAPSKTKLVLKGETTTANYSGGAGKYYTVNAVDEQSFQTAPAGIGYMGYNNKKPVAVITMNPSINIKDNTNITWSSSSSNDLDGDSIVGTEWKLDGTIKANPDGLVSVGNHTMELRVRDSKGNWSEWVSKTFTVISSGPQPLQATVPAGWIALNNADDISKIGNTGYPSNGKYILMQSIDLSTYNGGNWTPIASFYGEFDGNGLIINNLKINKSTLYTGLFATTQDAKIKDLQLTNVNIVGGNSTGGLIGQNTGTLTLSKIKVTGTITGGYQTGGLVGSFTGNYSSYKPIIDQCVVSANIKGDNYTGGLVGNASYTLITNSYVVGSLQGIYDTTPFVGNNAYGKSIIQNSYTYMNYKWTSGNREGTPTYTSTYANSLNTTQTIPDLTLLNDTQMKTKSSYVGWDFTNIWVINEGVSYPKLRWEK